MLQIPNNTYELKIIPRVVLRAPPPNDNSEKIHATKHNRFSVPWAIQPPPSRAVVDCGVLMVYKREDPLKLTARSPIIGRAFHPPKASNIIP